MMKGQAMKNILENIGVRLWAMKNEKKYREKVVGNMAVVFIFSVAILMIYEGVVY